MKEQLIIDTMILELELELDHQQNISFRIRYMALDWKWTVILEQGHRMITHLLINSLYETSNVHTEDQLRHPSVSPPSHTVKTGTQDLTSTLDEP